MVEGVFLKVGFWALWEKSEYYSLGLRAAGSLNVILPRYTLHFFLPKASIVAFWLFGGFLKWSSMRHQSEIVVVSGKAFIEDDEVWFDMGSVPHLARSNPFYRGLKN